MSNVIKFFELVGQDANLRHAKQAELIAAMKHAQVDPSLQSAILGRSVVRLHALLDAENRIYCSVFKPTVPERKQPPKPPVKKPGKAPAKKPAKAQAKKATKASRKKK
jgi:hypothetical protein